MLQLLTSTNLTEIIMGFGHGMDRGTIIMSFGILGIADYAVAFYIIIYITITKAIRPNVPKSKKG